MNERMSLQDAMREDKRLRGSGEARIKGVAPKEERTMDGIVFHSKSEMNRYWELKQLEAAGDISGLRLQPTFLLQPAFNHSRSGRVGSIRYTADFEYIDRNGEQVVEDVKGHRTERYAIVRKMLLYQNPELNFREVGLDR